MEFCRLPSAILSFWSAEACAQYLIWRNWENALDLDDNASSADGVPMLAVRASEGIDVATIAAE